jgi:hypothetical protein
VIIGAYVHAAESLTNSKVADADMRMIEIMLDKKYLRKMFCQTNVLKMEESMIFGLSFVS